MEIEMPNAVEEIFKEFTSRRWGVIRALTIDVDTFLLLCDPEKDELCLYGLPTKDWEVKSPVEVVPPVLPEPASGINFARDLMDTKEWLSLVAIHTDAWLLAVASFYGATLTNDKSVRGKLFNKINNLPTVLKVMNDYMDTVQTGRSRVSNSRYETGNCSRSEAEKEAELLEEHNDNICGACGEIYEPDEFWIFCDICKKWFHGQCVKITPAKAERIELFKCPSCNKKRARA